VIPNGKFSPLLFRDTDIYESPQRSLEDLQSGALAIVGIPYDYACGSRPGARWSPKAIRQSSIYFDHFLISESDQNFVDISTGKEFSLKEDIQVIDLGDVDLFPMDVERTMEAISGFIQQVVDKGAIPIVLRGGHFITYPTFCGYGKGISITQGLRRENIGYIHVDSHLDMCDEHPSWGKLCHPSTVRTIAESGLLDPYNMILIGVHGLVEKEIYEFFQKNSMKIITLERGFLLTVYGESTIRLTPPLIIEQDDIDRFVETFISVLKNVTGVDRD